MTVGAGAAGAAEAVARLGEASVRYDDARWRVQEEAASLRFEPQGAGTQRMDAVTVVLDPRDEPCEVRSARAFQFGAYDLGSIKTAPIRIGGIDGIRLAAHTRCRNATPRGVVACVRFNKRIYLVQALQAGCRGRNLFSRVDPIAEIADGIRFDGAPR